MKRTNEITGDIREEILHYNWDHGIRITEVEKTSAHHRSKVIVHIGLFFYLMEFDSMDQLDQMARTLGFNYKLREERENVTGIGGRYRLYDLDHKINDSRDFWKLEELPEDAKPVIGHSNGQLVTCYFTNDGEQITIYRPNPNAKEVYEPMSIDDHINYIRKHGRGL